MKSVESNTSVKQRRQWTADQKRALVLETKQPGMSLSAVARKYGVSPSQLLFWRRTIEEHAPRAVRSDEEILSAADAKELRERIQELEHRLERKTFELEILKDALEPYAKKNGSRA